MYEDVVDYVHEVTSVTVAMLTLFLMYRLIKMTSQYAAGLFPTYCEGQNYDLEKAQEIVDKAYEKRKIHILEENVHLRSDGRTELPIPKPPDKLTVKKDGEVIKYLIPSSDCYLYKDGEQWNVGGLNISLQNTIAFLSVFPESRITGMNPDLTYVYSLYRGFPCWTFVTNVVPLEQLQKLAVDLPTSIKIDAKIVQNWGGIRGAMTAFFVIELVRWPTPGAAFKLVDNNSVASPGTVNNVKDIVLAMDIIIIGMVLGFIGSMFFKNSLIAQRTRIGIYFALPILTMWSSSIYAQKEESLAGNFKMWMSIVATILAGIVAVLILPFFYKDRKTTTCKKDTPKRKADKDMKSLARSILRTKITKLVVFIFVLSLIVSTSAEYSPNATSDILMATVTKLPHSEELTRETFATYVSEDHWLLELNALNHELTPQTYRVNSNFGARTIWYDPSIGAFLTTDNATTFTINDNAADTAQNMFSTHFSFDQSSTFSQSTRLGQSILGTDNSNIRVPRVLINYARHRPYNPISYYPFNRPRPATRFVRKKRSLKPESFYYRVDPLAKLNVHQKPHFTAEHLSRNKRWTLLGICIFCSDDDDGPPGVSVETFNGAIKKIWGVFGKFQTSLETVAGDIGDLQFAEWALGHIAYLTSISLSRLNLIQSVDTLSVMDRAINPRMMSLDLEVAYTDLESQAKAFGHKLGYTLSNTTTIRPIYTVNRVDKGIWILGSFAMEKNSSFAWTQIEIATMFSQPRTECRQAILPAPFTMLFSADAKQYIISESSSVSEMYCYDSICGGTTKTVVNTDATEQKWLETLQTSIKDERHVIFSVPQENRNFPIEYAYKTDCWITGFGGWYLSPDGIVTFWLNGSISVQLTSVLNDETHTTLYSFKKWTALSFTLTGSTDVRLVTTIATEFFRITSSKTSHVNIVPKDVTILESDFQVGTISRRRYYFNLGDPPLASASTSGSIFGTFLGHILSGSFVFIIVFVLIVICWCQNSKRCCFSGNNQSSSPP